ncbi:Asp-tRNA(Asn)/Glu-tRNA(Gln) amidotransferase subunit GatA [Candidatus Gottesmanbacteria bacterium]|nr:Asp-tRNA(Asn)/Glu-tRNA(Gln) amidotransferase subunit GatA [Candidatus Gottesmanbacteria bacterium]MBI3576554.1 Asp-tRNA(Asn)/Glu-tRNA(Gln) amidotransferase subunit GatA [Candidatus Gottesmanbacteria bacterium]
MKLNTLTLFTAIEKLRRKEISHAELYQDIHEAIAEKNGLLNVYLSLDTNAVTKAEKLRDTAFAGVPVAVKDNFLTVGLPTTASSNVLKGFFPPFESTVTRRLKEAGGVIVGKTNMDAWAHGSSTETSDFGPTKNPRNTQYLPGGSSGGSAAAVAADLCIGALGTETAGSIRQPAAWCGVVGLKPTYGRVSRAGIVAMASSTDSPGVLGKTVRDCAILLGTIAGKDRYDGTTSPSPVPDYMKKIHQGVKGLRVGICYLDHPKLKGHVIDTAIAEAGKVFERLGAVVERVPLSTKLEKNSILTPDFALSVYTVVQRSEVSSNLARYDGIRYGNSRSEFGAEAKRRIMLGTFTLLKGYAERYYLRAQQVRTLYLKNFFQLFQTYDILVSSPSPGFALRRGALGDSPMFGELQDLLVEPSSLVGLPGISVPCFRDPKTNLSIGLNIMANYWQEETMIRAAYAFEQSTDWNSWVKEEASHG